MAAGRERPGRGRTAAEKPLQDEDRIGNIDGGIAVGICRPHRLAMVSEWSF